MQVVRNENKAYLISKVDFTGKGFKMSFRSYDVAGECGGFETTVIVAFSRPITEKGALALAPAYAGMKHEIKATAEVFHSQIVKMTTNNIVSEKFRFQNVRAQIA